jgi:hypothetical protein
VGQERESAAMAACVYARVHVCVCVCVCSRREGRGRGGARMRRAGREREGRGKNASHLTQLQERACGVVGTEVELAVVAATAVVASLASWRW